MSEDGADPTLARRTRRATTRHEVEIDARVVIGDRVETAVICDLSMGGAFVRCEHVSPGTAVTVRFHAPGIDFEIEAPAVVRWQADDGIGVRFEALRARDAWGLGKLLQTLP